MRRADDCRKNYHICMNGNVLMKLGGNFSYEDESDGLPE